LKRVNGIVDIKWYDTRADAVDYQGYYTALWMMSGTDGSESDLAMLDMLIAAGADVNAIDDDRGRGGNAPLSIAIMNGSDAIVERLRAAGAVFDVEALSATLVRMCIYGSVFQVERLLDAGADIEHLDRRGRSALRRASRHGRVDVVKLLLARGAEIDAHREGGFTAIMEALYTLKKGYTNWSGAEDVVKVLLEAGADLSIRSHDGKTALSLAYPKSTYVKEDSMTLFKQLLAHLDLVAEEPDYGDGPNSVLAKAVARGDYDTIHLIVHAGASQGIMNEALMRACSTNHEAIVHFLLDNGADVNARGRDKTVLMVATENQNLDIVRVLLAAGADVNAISEEEWGGETALKLAIHKSSHAGSWYNDDDDRAEKKKSLDIVHALLAAGADVNARDRNGRTALFAACESRRVDVVRAILGAGADVHARDDDDKSVLDVVEMYDHEMKRALRDAGATGE
jgi:ankyrin repeat protein